MSIHLCVSLNKMQIRRQGVVDMEKFRVDKIVKIAKNRRD